MTRAQAGRLWDAASRLRAGARIVEIGSFRGRSAIVLASAAPPGVAITTIDPHGGNDRGPQEIEGFEEAAATDHVVFWENLRAAGVDDRIDHLRLGSQEALSHYQGQVDLLYIDGAHRLAPARADIVAWGARVAPGGTMLIHDSFSSVGVTGAIVAELVFGGRFAYRGRSGSLAEYQRVPLDPARRMRNALRQAVELPWFVRNVVVKALIVARLGRLTRLLGSDGTWPY
ncbi:MAG: class I SAM-dependent methyltransferase [Acidimicrobiia bacterium]|nr:class I SAM-dependent methyltransferase [Acidimicrobiia bacterium]